MIEWIKFRWWCWNNEVCHKHGEKHTLRTRSPKQKVRIVCGQCSDVQFLLDRNTQLHRKVQYELAMQKWREKGFFKLASGKH